MKKGDKVKLTNQFDSQGELTPSKVATFIGQKDNDMCWVMFLNSKQEISYELISRARLKSVSFIN